MSYVWTFTAGIFIGPVALTAAKAAWAKFVAPKVDAVKAEAKAKIDSL